MKGGEVFRRVWRAVVSAPIVVLLLAGAAAASLGAWSFQASAAADFADANAVQSREIPDSDSAPPSPDENRAIIASLNRSINVRRQIDAQLQSIEESIAALSEQQSAAGQVTERALHEVRLIAASLGGARSAASTAVDRLGSLEQRLVTATRLARLIAEELEELDRKLGPSTGGPR